MDASIKITKTRNNIYIQQLKAWDIDNHCYYNKEDTLCPEIHVRSANNFNVPHITPEYNLHWGFMGLNINLHRDMQEDTLRPIIISSINEELNNQMFERLRRTFGHYYIGGKETVEIQNKFEWKREDEPMLSMALLNLENYFFIDVEKKLLSLSKPLLFKIKNKPYGLIEDSVIEPYMILREDNSFDLIIDQNAGRILCSRESMELQDRYVENVLSKATSLESHNILEEDFFKQENLSLEEFQKKITEVNSTPIITINNKNTEYIVLGKRHEPFKNNTEEFAQEKMLMNVYKPIMYLFNKQERLKEVQKNILDFFSEIRIGKLNTTENLVYNYSY